jgi:hypothetical protein
LPKNIKREIEILLKTSKYRDFKLLSQKEKRGELFMLVFLKKAKNSMQGMKGMLLQRSLPKDHEELMESYFYIFQNDVQNIIGCNLLKKAYFIFYLNINKVLRIGV